jgi:hypothetical protein
MRDTEASFDDDDGIYTAEDVYGATSDFWGESEDTQDRGDAVSEAVVSNGVTEHTSPTM